ncbi:MAG: TRAP transporter large permease [Alphaproteobacteria bacterium]|nr:TRAP transporter large permease [Alphaproteobacteria bacterium]MBV9863167.1 TRAP transporter large permease [Alphaproteobacteria bacterium]
MVTGLILIALLVLLSLGVPIGFALGIAGSLGLLAIGGTDTLLGILSTAPISTVSIYELIAIPMFVLMAEFVIVSRVAERLYDSLVIWVGRMPGGLAIATAFAGAGFGAISGSSTIGAATLASTSLPAMIRHGYERRMANGVVAISGTLGMLIPPSIALILYSILTDLSVAKLLIAGIIPGVIITFVIVFTVLFLVWRDPSRAPAGRSYSFGAKVRSLGATAPMLLLIVVVVGSIYLGLATPTEASSLGAFGAFCVAFGRGHLNAATFRSALANAARTTAMITTILLGAHIFGYALALTQTTQHFVAAIGGLNANRYVIIALVILLKLCLGFFLDQFAILILTVPIMVPLVVALGFDPIWFGVVLVLTAEVGMVTPPVGMNAFVIARYTGRPVEEVFAGVLPHVIAHLIAIVGFTIFPFLILWLPSTM